MFTSIISNAVGTLTVTNALICTATSLALGIIIALVYMSQGTYTKNFVVTLALMPTLVQTVIVMVNGNLGTGVAVLGAFSLVRFRSVPGSSREISSIFFAMAIGLATGMGYISFAVMATVIISAVILILTRTSFGESNLKDRVLKVTIPENLNYTMVFDDIFERYTNKVTLEKVKTVNLGSMYELHYNISLKDVWLEKEMIDEIRTRNGNLTIVCSKQQTVKEEL